MIFEILRGSLKSNLKNLRWKWRDDHIDISPDNTLCKTKLRSRLYGPLKLSDRCCRTHLLRVFF